MAASDNLNQSQFDSKFKDIAINEIARKKMGEHQGSFGDLAPRATEIATSCNHCGEDAEVNALYHPAMNTMHFRCPNCKKTDQASNWHEYGTNGRMRNAFTGEHFGPAKMDEHLSKPNPSLPAAPSWKQVTSKKWDKDGESEDEHDDADHSHSPKLSEDKNTISCKDCGKLLHTYKR